MDSCVTLGSGTVWRQQYDYYMEKEMEPASEKIYLRRRILIDLEKTIERYQDKNHKIIMVIDANEERGKITGHTYGSMVERLEITPAMEETYEEMKPSTTNGTKVIDHIELSGVDAMTIFRKGQLPHGMGFATDHRAMFIDLDSKQLFGLIPDREVNQE